MEQSLERPVQNVHGYPYLVDVCWCIDTIEPLSDDADLFDHFAQAAEQEGGGDCNMEAEQTAEN
eukprot:2182752-Karenia_brevis.AAC.1